MPPTPENRRIIRQINRPVTAISKAISMFAESDSVVDLPPAFRIVAKYLPLTSHILVCMKDELEDMSPDNETAESRRSVDVITANIDTFRSLTEVLEDYYESVIPEEGEDTARCLSRYRKVVNDSKGENVECTMEKLVGCFIHVLESISLTKIESEADTLLDQLYDAKREIKKVPASMDEGEKKQYTFNNKDHGTLGVAINTRTGDVQTHIGTGPGFVGNYSNNRFDAASPDDGRATPTGYELKNNTPIRNMKAAC